MVPSPTAAAAAAARAAAPAGDVATCGRASRAAAALFSLVRTEDFCGTHPAAAAAEETVVGAVRHVAESAAASAAGDFRLASWSTWGSVGRKRRSAAVVLPLHSNSSDPAAAAASFFRENPSASATGSAVLHRCSSCSSPPAAAAALMHISCCAPGGAENASALLQGGNGSSSALSVPAVTAVSSRRSRPTCVLLPARNAVSSSSCSPHLRSRSYISCSAASRAAAASAPAAPLFHPCLARHHHAKPHMAAASYSAARPPAGAAAASSREKDADAAVSSAAARLHAVARLRAAATGTRFLPNAATQTRPLSSAATQGTSRRSVARPAAAALPRLPLQSTSSAPFLLFAVSCPVSALKPSLRCRAGTAAIEPAAAAPGPAAATAATGRLAAPGPAAAAERAAAAAAEPLAAGRSAATAAGRSAAADGGIIDGRGVRLFSSSSRFSAEGKRGAEAVAAAVAPGGWGTRSMLLSLVCRGICVITGFGLAYSFTNPDEDTVYEVFPLEQQHRYALLTFYRVHAAAAADFEQRIKSLSRFYQQQQGYLFTRLLRAESLTSTSSSSGDASGSGSRSMKKGSTEEEEKEEAEGIGGSSSRGSTATRKDPYRYYLQISTWLTADDYVLASGKPMAQQLTAELPVPALTPTPVLYENVADDTKYTPSAVGAAAASPHPVAASSLNSHASSAAAPQSRRPQ